MKFKLSFLPQFSLVTGVLLECGWESLTPLWASAYLQPLVSTPGKKMFFILFHFRQQLYLSQEASGLTARSTKTSQVMVGVFGNIY